MSLKQYMSGKFNPTLSFDGVAMMTACVVCVLWFGNLHETVKQHSEILKNHEESIKSLHDLQRLSAQNIAVLQTLVNERTGNHQQQK